MTETIYYSELKNSIHDLENYSKEFDLDYAKNIVVALHDQGVLETFVKHTNWEEDFGGLSCHRFGKDTVEILFWFQCRVPSFCIIAPAFSVHCDLMTSKIIQIIDPYIDKNVLSQVH